MPATPAWLGSIEALLNRYIDASSAATALATHLQNTCLQVDIEGFTRIRATVCGARLALTPGDDSAADAVLAGSPPALLQLLSGANRPSGGTAARIRGDAQVASQYRELFTLARPDLEEELSRLVGDLPARHLSRLGLRSLAWIQSAYRTCGENIAEYLQEESRDLVNETELEEFLHGVDELRETADRVAVRLTRLEQRLKGAA